MSEFNDDFLPKATTNSCSFIYTNPEKKQVKRTMTDGDEFVFRQVIPNVPFEVTLENNQLGKNISITCKKGDSLQVVFDSDCGMNALLNGEKVFP